MKKLIICILAISYSYTFDKSVAIQPISTAFYETLNIITPSENLYNHHFTLQYNQRYDENTYLVVEPYFSLYGQQVLEYTRYGLSVGRKKYYSEETGWYYQNNLGYHFYDVEPITGNDNEELNSFKLELFTYLGWSTRKQGFYFNIDAGAGLAYASLGDKLNDDLKTRIQFPSTAFLTYDGHIGFGYAF